MIAALSSRRSPERPRDARAAEPAPPEPPEPAFLPLPDAAHLLARARAIAEAERAERAERRALGKRNWAYYWPTFRYFYAAGDSYEEIFRLILSADEHGFLREEDFPRWRSAMANRQYHATRKGLSALVAAP